MSSRRLCPQNPSSEEGQDTHPEGSPGISALAHPIAAPECPNSLSKEVLGSFLTSERSLQAWVKLNPWKLGKGKLPWFARQKNSHLPLSPPCSSSRSLQSGDGNRCCSAFPPTSPSPTLLKRESPGAPPWHLRDSAFPHLSHELVTRQATPPNPPASTARRRGREKGGGGHKQMCHGSLPKNVFVHGEV